MGLNDGMSAVLKSCLLYTSIPLVCFKSSHHEIPLLSKVKCLQDAYNNILSNCANQMEEDIHTCLLYTSRCV